MITCTSPQPLTADLTASPDYYVSSCATLPRIKTPNSVRNWEQRPSFAAIARVWSPHQLSLVTYMQCIHTYTLVSHDCRHDVPCVCLCHHHTDSHTQYPAWHQLSCACDLYDVRITSFHPDRAGTARSGTSRQLAVRRQSTNLQRTSSSGPLLQESGHHQRSGGSCMEVILYAEGDRRDEGIAGLARAFGQALGG